MGRKPALTPDQEQRAIERHIAGESLRSLAAEYGVAESSLRARISSRAQEIKNAAGLIAQTERTLTKMSISAQITARTVASKLMRAMDTMATGNELAAGSYLKLMMAANAASQRIDDANPMGSPESIGAIAAVSALTKVANVAGEMPMRMMAAMKGIAGEDDENGALRVEVTGGLPD